MDGRENAVVHNIEYLQGYNNAIEWMKKNWKKQFEKEIKSLQEIAYNQGHQDGQSFEANSWFN